MSVRKRRKKEKGRKKLAYSIVVIVFIVVLLAYFFLNQSNQTSNPKAALVDHLSRPGREPNPTFIQNSTTILKKAGFDVDYHGWEKLTDVNYYKSLFKESCDLFVLRVHSAITIIDGEEVVGLFTWEEYSDRVAGTKYREDVMDNRLVKAFFEDEPNVYYFGIAPNFVKNYGNFEDTTIIMMGCNGLTYTSMAEAFVKKGAKVYIGWNGLVSVDHTDQSTVNLLQSLLLKNRTIKQAVEEIGRDPVHNSALDYYPPRFEDYTIPNLESNSIMSVIYTSPKAARAKHKYGTQELCLSMHVPKSCKNGLIICFSALIVVLRS